MPAPHVISSISKEQLSNVHFENNFDFYFSKGTFHVATVLNHFMKPLEPYIESEVSVRIWGHAEWESQKELDREMEKYEHGADQILSLNKLTAVCSDAAISRKPSQSFLRKNGPSDNAFNPSTSIQRADSSDN